MNFISNLTTKKSTKRMKLLEKFITKWDSAFPFKSTKFEPKIPDFKDFKPLKLGKSLPQEIKDGFSETLTPLEDLTYRSIVESSRRSSIMIVLMIITLFCSQFKIISVINWVIELIESVVK